VSDLWYGGGVGKTVEENSSTSLLPNPNALPAISNAGSKIMLQQKILQFLNWGAG